MNVQDAFARIIGIASQRTRVVLVALGLLAVSGAVTLTQLRPSNDIKDLVNQNSSSYRATETFRQSFGDHAIAVLVRGPLPDLVLTSDLGRLLGLEGCLSGRKPVNAPAPGGPGSPCAEFAKTQPIEAVYGPGTFLNAAVSELQTGLRKKIEQTRRDADRAAVAARTLATARRRSPAYAQKLAQAATQIVYAGLTRDLVTLGLKYGLSLTHVPTLDDPQFISAVVFDPRRGASTPKSRFAYLFPSANSALIQVRLKPNLTTQQRSRAIEQIKAAVRMPEWHLRGGSYTVSGEPVVMEDVSAGLNSSLLRTLLIAFALMAVVLACVFRAPRRLLPLLIAAAAAATTYGLLGLLGVPLTIATIAVIPILIGLGVDYGIQFQSRVSEELATRALNAAGALQLTARRFAPTMALALCATLVGFLGLLASPLPLVHQFALALATGALINFVFIVLATSAVYGFACHATDGGRGRSTPMRSLSTISAGFGAQVRIGLAVSRSRARLWRTSAALASRILNSALRRPRLTLAFACGLACIGLALESQTPVVSDVRQLAPPDSATMKNLNQLTQMTGMAGEIDVLVQAKDVTKPAVVNWLRKYKQELLRDFKYSDQKSCSTSPICPAFSLPDLVRDPRAAGTFIGAIPPYFSRAVVTPDRRTTTLSFGLKLMSLDRQRAIIARMRSQLHPPHGVTATVAGLPVVVADADTTLSDPFTRLLTLLGTLLAVTLVLLAAWRGHGRGRGRARLAVICVLPIALAVGWTALLLAIANVSLNSLSAIFATLVIAIATEFSVLMTARFNTERERGGTLNAVTDRVYRTTGRAVLSSTVTVLTGFVVLTLSDIELLQSFGFVAIIGLTIAVISVFVMLPVLFAVGAGAAKIEVPDFDDLEQLRVSRRQTGQKLQANAGVKGNG